MAKLIIFSAPSGSGKTSIVQQLLKMPELNLGFSISTTSRALRGNEKNGVDYYFVSAETFKNQIKNNAFLEWEEVYTDNFYGTYKSEISRLSQQGKNILFDIDVFGGINLKNKFKNDALSIFIQPPSLTELRNRLEKRQTDKPEKIEMRLSKAQEEMQQAAFFDHIIINDDLQSAINQARELIIKFL